METVHRPGMPTVTVLKDSLCLIRGMVNSYLMPGSSIIIIRFLINVQVHHLHQCMGPFPGNWLAAHIADLAPDLQVLLS